MADTKKAKQTKNVDTTQAKGTVNKSRLKTKKQADVKNKQVAEPKPIKSTVKKSTAEVKPVRKSTAEAKPKKLSGVEGLKEGLGSPVIIPEAGKQRVLMIGDNVNYEDIKAILYIGSIKYTTKGFDVIFSMKDSLAYGGKTSFEWTDKYNGTMSNRLASVKVYPGYDCPALICYDGYQWGTPTKVTMHTVDINRTLIKKNTTLLNLVEYLIKNAKVFGAVTNFVVYTNGTDLKLTGTTAQGITVRAILRLAKPEFVIKGFSNGMAESTFKSKTVKVNIPKDILNGCISGIM